MIIITIQKAGKLSLDLSKLKLVLSSMRKRPHMPTLELRKDLSEVVPHFQGISCQYCVNFWRKVHLYFMKHPSNTELTMEDAQNTCDKKSCTNEDINTDDPIVKVNLRELFQNIIQEDNNSWKAISLLKLTKETCLGFDYRIHYNDDGVPDGFMWMSPGMRNDLIPFHDIFYLDAQCRQLNKSMFPYISPIVTNSENQLAQTSEGLFIEEFIPCYTWVFKMMSEMEPKFQLRKIRIIFGDGKITNKLLDNLGIDQACILHGDYYHLIDEVWPKSFGNTYDQIKCF